MPKGRKKTTGKFEKIKDLVEMVLFLSAKKIPQELIAQVCGTSVSTIQNINKKYNGEGHGTETNSSQ